MLVLRLICALLQVYVYAIIIRAILSWVEVPGAHPVGRTVAWLSKVVDPPLRSVGRMLPAVLVGRIRLDLSPIVLIMGILLVSRIICR